MKLRYTQVKEIFGKVIAYFKVIAFLKSGLPHACCVFYIDRAFKDKLNDPKFIDTMINAEIPSENDQILRQKSF